MAFYITGGAEHDEVEANKDQRIAELENALRLARPYLAVQLQQLTHVVNDPHVAEARNNLYLIDKALGE